MNKVMKLFAAGVLLLGGGLFLNTAIAQQKTIAIGTGGTGGVYYPIGGGLANIISKYLGVQATAEVTGGSVDNLKLIGAEKSEIGFSMADAALDAQNGQGKFTAGKIPLRTLMVLYPNIMHVVTIDGTGIEKFDDLKGKRVSTGSPGSATEVMAYITHGVLSGGAVARITASKLQELVITDSIQPTEAVLAAPNIRVCGIAPLIGEAIARTAHEQSVSSLFD